MIRPTLRENDRSIMDIALQQDLTDIQLKRVNAVREWFNVKSLSEICEPNGITLARGFYFGNSGDNWYQRIHPGPKQSKPNSYSFKFWQKVLDTVMTASWNLKEPLGNWKPNHSKHGIWKAYMSHPFVYEHIPAHNSWNVYRSINFQLLLETSIPFDQFDRSNAIPIAI